MKVFLLGSLVLLGVAVSAQVRPKAPVQSIMGQSHFDSQVTILDRNGRPFHQNDIDVEGSPFFTEHWLPAVLRTATGGHFDVLARIDLQTQEVHYMDSNSTEMVVSAGFVQDAVLYDSTLQQTFVFRCGFPKIDNQTEASLYQVLTDRRLFLLKSMRKVIRTEKDEVSGEQRKVFVLYEDFYLYVDGKLSRVRRDPSFFLPFMQDHKEQVTSFIRDQKINFRKTDDLVQLLNYYNSLSEARVGY